ncbi:MAG: rhodanese-like domain-containing protein [Desulfopila sp.]
MKRFFVVGCIAMMSFVVVGCAGHGTSPKGKEIPIENASVKLVEDIKASDYKYQLIRTDELKKWYDEARSFTIISTLPIEEDEQDGILPGALNGGLPMTEAELTEAYRDNLIKVAGIDKEKTIVVYCGFVACRRSTLGAKILVDNGFKNVYKYPGGIVAWEEKGYPVAKK